MSRLSRVILRCLEFCLDGELLVLADIAIWAGIMGVLVPLISNEINLQKVGVLISILWIVVTVTVLVNFVCILCHNRVNSNVVKYWLYLREISPTERNLELQRKQLEKKAGYFWRYEWREIMKKINASQIEELQVKQNKL